jgi:Ca-activated chloride channel homolog
MAVACGVALLVITLAGLGLAGCKKKEGVEDDRGASPPAAAAAAANRLELVISYGSEKKTWLEAELKAFNDSQPKLASGRVVRAAGKAKGSGEGVAEILDGSAQPHVFSPASGAYLSLLNDAWQRRPGNLKPIAQAGEPLVLSPLVIAMWKPMAEALGWPGKPLGWADILKVARDRNGWATYGRPEWGELKLGHTSPELSTSGLLSVLAMAAAAKTSARGGDGPARMLTAADLAEPGVKTYLAAVQDAVVHYGKSTGFFADKMLDRGPSYLSAAVLYENLVIESYNRATPAPLPLVAIYPVEGTFWADHPFAVLDAPWVTPEHKEAAALLQQFLRARPQQEHAVALGFRAADPAIPISAPIDAAHGCDPKQPQNLLEVPDAPTLQALIALWRETKKASDVVLVFDKSGSMRGEPLVEAKQGAKAFLGSLDPRDRVTLLFFDDRVYPPIGPFEVGKSKQELEARIDGTIADGGTALYDAVAAAVTLMRKPDKQASHRIRAVVAMTDGKDENSQLSQAAVEKSLGSERSDVIVFTVAYGTIADGSVLESIANAGNGGFVRGDVASIIQVFRDMAAYF